MQPSRRAMIATTAAAALSPRTALATSETPRADLEVVFASHGAVGTFVLFDAAKDSLTLVNAALARKHLIPASTFKIANSLIALETGVVKDENEIIPYGGKPQPMKQWERDMSMRDAIIVSNVPIYQELARRVGLTRYRDWLARLGYGNRETGSDVEHFWLRGPLEITPVEQASFVARLARGRLEASPRSQAIVRDILRIESNDGATLFAKTGFATASVPSTAWWIGWVERAGSIHSFAIVVMGLAMADAGRRLVIGRALLDTLGVYKSKP